MTKDLAKKLKKAFFSGIFVLLPLYVTYSLVQFLLDKVGTPASQLFFGRHAVFQDLSKWSSSALSVIAVLMVILMIMFFGWLSNYFLGKFFIRLTDNIIHKIPFISTVHKTVKQIIDTFSQEKLSAFSQTVLVCFPREGIYSIGFLTNDAKGEIKTKLEREFVNVFIPTTPNPTTGFLILAPKDEIIYLNMSAGDAIKAIISGGVVVPDSVDTRQFPANA